MKPADRHHRPSALAIAYFVATLGFALIAAALLTLANCDPAGLI